MRPLRLVLTSFGPFAANATVDFEHLGRHGMFLIHGPTGAGKSTLLDAMTYALFGDAKGGPERGGVSFVSSLAPLERTSVTLEFAVGDRRYRVVRHPSQQVARSRGDGSASVTRQAEARLERLGVEGEVTETLAEKATEASQAVQALLGLSVEQFRQTVVLPQGQFREVVTDEKAREAVLKRLFDTRRFADLTEQLKAIASELGQAGEAERRAREQVLARAGVEHRDALAEAAKRCEAALLEADRRRATREAEREAAHGRLVESRSTLERFDRLDLLEARLEAIAGQEDAVGRDRERLAAARRALRLEAAFERRARAHAEREAARTARDDAHDAEVSARARHEAALAAVALERGKEGERARAGKRVTDMEALEDRVRGLGEQRARQAALLARIAAARAELDGAREARERLVQERAELRGERDALRATAAELDTRRERLDACRRSSEGAGAIALLDAAIAADAQRHEALGLDEGHAPDGPTLLELVRSQAAGLVSAGLQAGAPCPVCGSTHHPSPHPGAEPEALDASLRRFQNVESARAALAATLTLQRDQRAALLSEHGWDGGVPPAAQIERALRDATTAHGEAKAAVDRVAAIDARLDTLSGEVEAADGRCSTLSFALRDDEHEAAAAERDIDQLVAALPSDATDPDAFLEHLAAARAEDRALMQALADAEAGESSAREALAGHVTRLEERRERLASAEASVAEADAAFASGLEVAGFADAAAFEAARLDEASATAIQQHVDAHDEARASATAQRDELRGALEGAERPDVSAAEAALEAAHAAWREADAARSAAQQAHDAMARAVAEFEAADERYRAVEDRLAAALRLARLAGGTVPGRPKVDLETFVLQRQFYDVLRVGNVHLREMTAGRYSLHLVRDTRSASATGLDLEVADHFVDSVRRPAKTLSGGEGFLAALALALGLSDIAQRSRHPIEALFIDEGFGSLDRDTLAQVTHMLRTLPQTAGRLIGIISHVEDLKRLIPVQLVVSASERGSRLEVRVNA